LAELTIRALGYFVYFQTLFALIRLPPSHPLISLRFMASPRSMPARPLAPSERRYRRSSFNGAKQLAAAQAPNRRILVLLGLLAVALLAVLAVIVGMHLGSGSEPAMPGAVVGPATHPAGH
jgi:hypothetical protein